MRASEIKGRVFALRGRMADKGPRIAELAIDNLSGFGTINVALDNAFLAICGGTGTGKSTLLAAVYAGLIPITDEGNQFAAGRISGFQVGVRVTGPGGEFHEKRNFANEVAPSEGYAPRVFLETIDDRTDLSRQSAISDVEALKEGVEPFELDADALGFLRLICRKDYTRIQVYETELEGDKYYPHFEVEEAINYSSESMGSGEHSACYLAWRISTAPANSILLIEEPEALLPPIAHEQMCAMIALFAQKRGLLPIFTTHSTGIVNFLADGDLISLSRLGGTTALPNTTEGKARVLAKLGLLPKRPIMALVEDDVGKAVLEELIEQFGFSDVIDANIVIVTEGAGGIKTILEMLSPAEPVSAILGFLDGDMEAEAKRWPCKSRLLYLPVAKAPEVEFLAAMEADSGEFAARINRPAARLTRALEKTRGQDHHDRFVAIASALGFDHAAFTKAAFNHYVSGADGGPRATEFANTLAAALGVIPPDLS